MLMKKIILFIAFLCPFIFAAAQNRTITGKVTDEKGVPIANASVIIKETKRGTSTDASGNFSISVDNKSQKLLFSYTGKNTQEVSIGNRSVLNITLQQGESSLQEVVVVAYGTQSKKKITGAVAKVDGAELENKPFSSLDQLLQGKVPGLLSTSPTGQPGGIQQVRIRGIGSITAGAAPLFVVDGVIINTGDFSRLSNTSNALAGLNPNDVESITVLKDAAATALYGARAGNGVILITTKKGRTGKSMLKVDAETGFGSTAYFNDLAKPLNRDQYFTLTKEGLVNAGATPAQMDATLASLGYTNTYDEDWVKLVTRQGSTQNINASLSGGDNKTTFFTSAGFFDQKQSLLDLTFVAIRLL